MLMWERLGSGGSRGRKPRRNGSFTSCRLPYDNRCAATTKKGRRCRARIRKGEEFCTFHDPNLSQERRREIASKGGKSNRNLAHIPGGYLRKLNSRRAVSDAMNRLYRELRLGMVTPEMGSVLFAILTRVLDSGLCEGSSASSNRRRPGRIDLLRPKLSELLTREERRAWRKAAASAPAEFLHPDLKVRKARANKGKAAPSTRKVALPAAS